MHFLTALHCDSNKLRYSFLSHLCSFLPSRRAHKLHRLFSAGTSLFQKELNLYGVVRKLRFLELFATLNLSDTEKIILKQVSRFRPIDYHQLCQNGKGLQEQRKSTLKSKPLYDNLQQFIEGSQHSEFRQKLLDHLEIKATLNDTKRVRRRD
mmetsp:Transcript_38137/g.36497  ORF Transcript_38137/g.36497 Transcript_38137/m.36497 type:complete len:152 (-) Transcript_38137:176-631(-)